MMMEEEDIDKGLESSQSSDGSFESVNSSDDEAVEGNIPSEHNADQSGMKSRLQKYDMGDRVVTGLRSKEHDESAMSDQSDRMMEVDDQLKLSQQATDFKQNIFDDEGILNENALRGFLMKNVELGQ